MNKVIALGADNGYMDKVETTIKSVCVHNDNIKFYVFNDDLPSEWFRVMNKRLEIINSQIVNAKISDNHLRKYHLPRSVSNKSVKFPSTTISESRYKTLSSSTTSGIKKRK